jgi:hypothetical protein
MNIDPQEKMITKERLEKYILRKAFDTSDEPGAKPYLPHNVLYRQKEQFSDGVGYGWIDALKDNAELHVTDEMMKNPKPEWGTDIPDSKEAYVLDKLQFPVTNGDAVTGIGQCSMSSSHLFAHPLLSDGRLHGPNKRILVEGKSLIWTGPRCYQLTVQQSNCYSRPKIRDGGVKTLGLAALLWLGGGGSQY